MGNKQIVENFLKLLYVDRDEMAIRDLLSPEMEYNGPNGSWYNADDYIKNVATKIPDRLVEKIEILEMIEEGNNVAAFHECFSERVKEKSVAFAEWFKVEDGIITEINIYFDTRPFIEFL